jgi:hypothetical protein
MAIKTCSRGNYYLGCEQSDLGLVGKFMRFSLAMMGSSLSVRSFGSKWVIPDGVLGHPPKQPMVESKKRLVLFVIVAYFKFLFAPFPIFCWSFLLA